MFQQTFLGKPSTNIEKFIKEKYPVPETKDGSWILYDEANTEIMKFENYSEPKPIRRWENSEMPRGNVTFGSSSFDPIPHWDFSYLEYRIDDEEKLRDPTARVLNVANSDLPNKYTLKWFN